MTDAECCHPTILIADDHQVLAEGLAATLGPHYTIVGQVHALEQLKTAIVRRAPDVVILDLSFHGTSALPQLKQLTADPTVASKFVVLTGLESPALATAAFDAGAMAFLQKGAGVQELRMAIEAAMAGRRYSDGTGTEEPARLARHGRRDSVVVDGISLKPRQVEVLWLLLRGHSRAAVASRLGFTDKAVDYHLVDLRTLLGVKTTRMVMAWAVTCQDEISAAFAALRNQGSPAKADGSS
jgi:two-component system capsular synthesis response regulator RcsB